MMQSLKTFRAEKDDFYAHHPRSPLTTCQKDGFKFIDYIPKKHYQIFEVN